MKTRKSSVVLISLRVKVKIEKISRKFLTYIIDMMISKFIFCRSSCILDFLDFSSFFRCQSGRSKSITINSHFKLFPKKNENAMGSDVRTFLYVFSRSCVVETLTIAVDRQPSKDASSRQLNFLL